MVLRTVRIRVWFARARNLVYAEGAYERFYSRVHVHFARGVRTRRFLCTSRKSGVLNNSRRVFDLKQFTIIDFILGPDYYVSHDTSKFRTIERILVKDLPS